MVTRKRGVGTYRDSLLRNKDLRWKVPKWTVKEDGKLDLNIHIPLSDILDRQARQSFLYGVAQYILWENEQPKGVPISGEAIDKAIDSLGLGDLWQQIRAKQKHGNKGNKED